MPFLMPENSIIEYVLRAYGGILVTGNNDINVDSIRWIVEIEEIKNKDIFTKKIIAYLRTGLNLINKEASN